MDHSSFSESQLQQLHQQYYQQQPQEQHQVQPYDPSQVQSYDHSQLQAYDQSNQAYYQQYHQYQQQQHQYQPYYQPDYSNSYQQSQSQIQNDSTPIQPPGVSAAPEPVPQQVFGHGHLHQQPQNSYYPVPTPAEQQPNLSGYPVPSGLNPAAAAAVAALSQLTQFAGTMDAAERAMAGIQDRQWHGKNPGYGPMQMPPHMAPRGGFNQGTFPGHRGGRPPYRGGGRRGGGPFRGGSGRGNFGHRSPRTDGSTPQFHGRGRGRGGNRRFPQRAASSNPEAMPTGEVASVSEHGNLLQGETPGSASGTASGPAPPLGKASSTRKQPQIAWCELCRVDCTSLDILEQHKNGKKHKKNLQRFEELQRTGNPMILTKPGPAPVIGSDPTPIPSSAPASVDASATASVDVSATTTSSVPALASSSLSELATTPMPEVPDQQQTLPESKIEVIAQAENVEGGEPKKSEAPENMPTEVIDDGSKMESEQQIEKAGHAVVEDGEPAEAPGKKRKFDRFDTRKRGMNRKVRGGRGGKRRPFDRPTRQVEPPKPKEVVPIICDLCNVKCDTQAVFETHLAGKKHMSKLKRFQGHQAMFGPLGLQALYPPNPSTQPIFIPQVHQQSMYPPHGSFHQPAAAYVPHVQQTMMVTEPQAIQNPENQGAHVTWDGSQNNVAPVSEVQQGAVAGQEGQLTALNIPENSVVGSEEKAFDIRPELSALPPQENMAMESSSATPAKDGTLTVADYGLSTSSEKVAFLGLESKTEDVTTKNDGQVG